MDIKTPELQIIPTEKELPNKPPPIVNIIGNDELKEDHLPGSNPPNKVEERIIIYN